MNEIRLRELLPLLRGKGFDYRGENMSVLLCLESERWTWVHVNLSSGLLDLLTALVVEQIDVADNKLRLWVRTNEFNVPEVNL